MSRRRVSLRDLAAEALAGLMQRPGRSSLTALGTVLGIGAFVAVLGVTGTAAGQIDKRFTALSATEVVVEDVGAANVAMPELSFRPDSSARIKALTGTAEAGVWWTVGSDAITISATLGTVTGNTGLSVMAAEGGAVAAMRPLFRAGRMFDAFHVGRSERVAVLGSIAATRLGVTHLDGAPAIFLNGTPYTVIGILENVERAPEALFSIIIPTTAATSQFGAPVTARAKMIIDTELGAAQVVATQAALALRPDAPELFRVSAPVNPERLRGAVTNDINVLFLILAAVTLAVGAFGIANTTLVSVLERTNEIGVRRSLGARRWHIGLQFLLESTALGLLGGLVGAAVGVCVVISVALARHWTALIDPWSVIPAPALGALVGLLAGIYPAVRSATVEPVAALRR